MGATTEIAWTDATFNPWWGCVEVSPGCTNCYARTFSKRVGLAVWGKGGERREFGDKHWNEPRKWNAAAEKAGKRMRAFCASMADVFEDHPVAAKYRPRMFETIEQTPWIDWQLLTKRAENMLRFAPTSWRARWPRNVWAGTTAEDQRRADERIPHLFLVPAVVRFVSAEPLLERVDLSEYLYGEYAPEDLGGAMAEKIGPRLDWVIVGGESGAKSRPFDITWARQIVEDCQGAEVPCFMKQAGARPVSSVPDDPEYRVGTIAGPGDAKGGDMSRWPEWMRVREFPRAA